jgi:hypothetical protein
MDGIFASFQIKEKIATVLLAKKAWGLLAAPGRKKDEFGRQL